MKKRLFLAFLSMAISGGIWAQGTGQLRDVTHTYAIKNAFVVQKPGQVIDMGTVIIKNGLITDVGKNIKIPGNAKILKADSMYVYAGFIDGLSNTGIPEPRAQQGQGQQGQGQGQRPRNAGNPTNEEAGILPEAGVREKLDPKDKSIEELRKLGFTAAHVAPRGRMMPGRGSIVLLTGDKPEEMIYEENISFNSQLVGARGFYPATILAVMSKWRELYEQAKQSKTHEATYAKDPTGMARPKIDDALQAFYPVIEGKQPVVMATSDIKSIHRALTLKSDLGFPLILADVKQGWHAASKIKSDQIPLFLSLDLPEDKKTAEAGNTRSAGRGPAAGKAGATAQGNEAKKEEKKLTPEQEALEKRREESMKQHVGQAAEMQKQGISFGFSSFSAKPAVIKANLNRMIEAGLSADAALASLTTQAAKMLGLDASMGTVEKGKIGNLVVSDKPYFDKESNVRFVIVDGDVYEYEAPEKKKGDAAAKVDVAGAWSYTVDAEGQQVTGLLNLEGNDGNLQGTISSSMTNQKNAIKNASLSGNNLSFSSSVEVDGYNITTDFKVVVEGETFSGTVSAGQYGTFKVKGKKTPN